MWQHRSSSGRALLSDPDTRCWKGSRILSQKDGAAQIQLPSSRMQYRLAKEIALGKPCDESARNCRHWRNKRLDTLIPRILHAPKRQEGRILDSSCEEHL